MANIINKLQFNTSFCNSIVSSGKKLAALNYFRSTIISINKLKKLNKNFNQKSNILGILIAGLDNCLMIAKVNHLQHCLASQRINKDDK